VGMAAKRHQIVPPTIYLPGWVGLGRCARECRGECGRPAQPGGGRHTYVGKRGGAMKSGGSWRATRTSNLLLLGWCSASTM
jgi:hypothetical protein